MAVLKARIGGVWVPVGGGGGGGTSTSEVEINAADPIGTNPAAELWYDTDAPAQTTVSLTSIPKTTALGSLGAGPYTWPSPARDVGDYAGTSTFYTTAGGALQAGMYGVSCYFDANTSDAGFFSMNLSFAGRGHTATNQFAFATFGTYQEDYLTVGQHITWVLYKHTGMVAFASCSLRLALTYRPVNA